MLLLPGRLYFENIWRFFLVGFKKIPWSICLTIFGKVLEKTSENFLHAKNILFDNDFFYWSNNS